MNMEKEKQIENERVCISIDGGNLYNSLKIPKEKKDFEKLTKNLVGNRKLVKVSYYTANLNIKKDEEKYWNHQKFLEELRKISKFNVILCNIKGIKQDDGKIKYFIKGDDARLIHDFVVRAYENLYNIAIIISDDEDFKIMIKTVRIKGKKVGNAFFRSSSSNLLREACDFSVCIDKNRKDLSLSEDYPRSIINN